VGRGGAAVEQAADSGVTGQHGRYLKKEKGEGDVSKGTRTDLSEYWGYPSTKAATKS
jgi:hypothetical protein